MTTVWMSCCDLGSAAKASEVMESEASATGALSRILRDIGVPLDLMQKRQRWNSSRGFRKARAHITTDVYECAAMRGGKSGQRRGAALPAERNSDDRGRQ